MPGRLVEPLLAGLREACRVWSRPPGHVPEPQRERLDQVQQLLGVTFDDPSLLLRALTHSSYLNENQECQWGDNERLEFLGDAVSDLLAAEYLYRRFPDWEEGALTALRANLVRSEALGELAAAMGLDKHLLLGRGEEKSGGRKRLALLGDAFEAVVAAVYLDRGMGATRRFLVPRLERQVNALTTEAPVRDAKSRLQEWAQATRHETPSYKTVQESGPDHAKSFSVQVSIGGQVCGEGRGRSKRVAEEAAARNALESR